jgi:hypothetical protein
MRLDSESIKLLLVITPGFGRVIGDEEDAFLCKERTKGSDRAGQGSAGEGDGNRMSRNRACCAVTYSGCVEYGGPPPRRL